MTDKPATDEKLKPCPFEPAFEIGDIVEIGGDYAGDWRGTLHYIGEITWDRKRNTLKYGTYQTDCKDGMTTDWEEQHLVMYKPRNTRARTTPDPQILVDALEDILVHEEHGCGCNSIADKALKQWRGE